MDALTWFKSVFQRAPLRADVATELWPDVPLHLVAAHLRPPVAPADGDEDWDAVIARAKVQAALPKASRPPPAPTAIGGDRGTRPTRWDAAPGCNRRPWRAQREPSRHPGSSHLTELSPPRTL